MLGKVPLHYFTREFKMARVTYKERIILEQEAARRTWEGYGDPPLRQEPPRYAEEEAKIPGLGNIFFCAHPDFKSSLEVIMEKCDEVISLRDLAYARIKQGKYGGLTQNGSFVREGSLFIPKKEDKRILLRDSLVLKDPAHYGCYEVAIDELYMPESFNVDAYLEQIGKDNYLILKDTSPVPANRLGEDERAVWLYQDQAKDYGLFLESLGEKRLVYGHLEKVIPELSFYMYMESDEHIDKQPRPFAQQLWLGGKDIEGPTSTSMIVGDWCLQQYRLRGLRRENPHTD
ncbi:hypothetical protein JXB28_02285 [Candidatus Woesearchaeota archaeon]|nr:hypothetical protein [Candidatus Woesearchaeota archaeon]